MKGFKYVEIKDKPGFYEDIYNYLLSKKLNTKENGKTNWHNVIYPSNLIDEKDTQKRKDKKRQNFRLIAEKHTLSNENILYIKKINKENKIELLQIPYENENGIF